MAPIRSLYERKKPKSVVVASQTHLPLSIPTTTNWRRTNILEALHSTSLLLPPRIFLKPKCGRLPLIRVRDGVKHKLIDHLLQSMTRIIMVETRILSKSVGWRKCLNILAMAPPSFLSKFQGGSTLVS